MSELPPCPKCSSKYVYEDAQLLVCPECAFEWSKAGESSNAQTSAESDGSFVVKDASGTVLQDGDSVVVIKDLKLKGSSQVLKVGTKVRNIRLVDSDHNIDCKIDGFGEMALKSEFVRKQS